MTRFAWILSAAFACGLAAACDDDDDDSAAVCKPGDRQDCTCQDGSPSTQACNGAGNGWQECDCDTGEADPCARTDTENSEVLPIVAKATITVPDGFAAVPLQLWVSFANEWAPPGKQSYPAGLGANIPCVEIGPGQPYELETYAAVMLQNGTPLIGSYYLSVLLYVEGGGASNAIPIPVGGIDYSGMSAESQAIDPDGPVADFGTIELALWPEDVVIDMDASVPD